MDTPKYIKDEANSSFKKPKKKEQYLSNKLHIIQNKLFMYF